MSLARDYHPEATEELVAAAEWYETEQSGLGVDFLAKAEEAVQQILDWPNMAPVFPGWDREPIVHTRSVERFPFQVIYYLTDTDLRVIAFAHNRRKPRYWEERI